MILSILNQIAATSKTTEKLKIVKLYKNDPTLKNTFRLAYNKRISFGIKKIPERQIYRGIISLDKAMYELEYRFATRELTGNAAIQRLQEIMGSMNENNAEVIRRIILRDLECGCSEGTANKVWGADLIPSQPCMKASSQSDKTLANIRYPAIAQLKADGTRCMIIKEKGEVTAWSRNGKQFQGIEHILDLVKNLPDDNFVIDGELIYKSDVNKVQNRVVHNGNFCATELGKPHSGLGFLFGEPEPEVELSKSKDFKDVLDRQTGNGIVGKSLKGTLKPKEAKGIVFQCWDFISSHNYWNGIAKVQYKHRMVAAQMVINDINSPYLEWIETHVVNSLAEAKVIYQSYIDQDLEGIILKNMDGIWEDKRSKDQVKFKAVIDIDMIIVGHYAHDKDPNKLGGLTIRSKCGLIECNVGSGFKDGKASMEMEERHELDRTLLMSIALTLYDSVLECECNGAVKRKKPKEGESPYKLFLPIAKCIRFDKNAIDANTYEEIFG
jgi:ATP-dependent DNA ligase